MPSPTIPEDVVNRALDECGVDAIGDIAEGSTAANAARRIYYPTLRQLLSAAHWNFARMESTLILLAGTPAATSVPISAITPPSPWSFMYEWPVDCVNARFVPQTNPTGVISWFAPAPFIVSNYMIPNTGDWGATEGHDAEQTRVILTNVDAASLVYTKLMQYPDAWDPLFEQALVAVLASRLAMPCQPDKKLARAIRADNIEIARQCLADARARDGNEGWTVQDHIPDWIQARTGGSGWADPYWYGGNYMPMPGVDGSGGVY